MIYLSGRNEYKTEESRKEMAVFLTALMEGNFNSSFRPYMPNKGDSTYWTIDSGNDWKVQFFDDDVTKFGIRYRYQTKNQEEAFANWLCVRMPSVSIRENKNEN